MYDVYKTIKIAEGLCVETQSVEKVKPDSLNLSVKTVVGSGSDIKYYDYYPVFAAGFLFPFSNSVRLQKRGKYAAVCNTDGSSP